MTNTVSIVTIEMANWQSSNGKQRKLARQWQSELVTESGKYPEIRGNS